MGLKIDSPQKSLAMKLFRGNESAKVDDKGRLKMPTDFKRLLDELEYGPDFFVTSRTGENVEIYPMREWEKIEEQVKAKTGSAAKRKFLDATSFYGQVVEMDGQGRLTLPQKLREKANTVGEVGVLGQHTYFRVVNAQSHEAKLDLDPMTDADMEALDIDGL